MSFNHDDCNRCLGWERFPDSDSDLEPHRAAHHYSQYFRGELWKKIVFVQLQASQLT